MGLLGSQASNENFENNGTYVSYFVNDGAAGNPPETHWHTGLIGCISIQITALTACITLKNQPLWLGKVIFSFLCMSNQ